MSETIAFLLGAFVGATVMACIALWIMRQLINDPWPELDE